MSVADRYNPNIVIGQTGLQCVENFPYLWSCICWESDSEVYEWWETRHQQSSKDCVQYDPVQPSKQT